MNREQLTELRKAAEEATPGPWSFYDDSNDGKTNRIEIVATGKTVARIYHSVPAEDLPNARHIALANPSAIISLLDHVERLEKDAARYRWLRDEHYIINPLAAVVWKKNDDRDESEWVNTVDGYSLDCHIDAAMGESK